VACLPVDTPVDQAPAAIGKVWRDRDVMIVPACSVFDVKLPAFVNLARSAGLSDAEARRIAEARVRSEQMANWGLATGQLHVTDQLSPTTVYTPEAVDAVSQGYSVVGQPDRAGCATPSKITVVDLPTGTADGLDKSDLATAPGPYGLIIQYGPGACIVVGLKDGQTKVLVRNDPAQIALLLSGVVRRDPAIGVDYWYYIATGTCGKTNVASQLCTVAGY
jgi:hypothetical protein